MSFKQRLKDAEVKVLTLDIENYAAVVRAWGLWDVNVSLSQLVEPSRTFGVAYKWYHEKDAHFVSEFTGTAEEMFEKVHTLLCEADIVISFNGQRFDIPHLMKHFVLLGLGKPSPFKQVDLLTVVRKEFKFMSNKLDHIAAQLGLGTKTSHQGFDLWTQCEQGDPKARALMTKYAKQDVLLTEKLYNRLLGWIPNHPHLGMWIGSEWVCSNCGKDIDPENPSGTAHTFNQQYNSFQCTDCGHWLRSSKNKGVSLKTRSAR